MIKRNQLVPVGDVGKTHGLKGELQMNIDADIPVEAGTCLIFEIDGIYVPFFVESARRRTAESRLVKIDGIDNDSAGAELCGLTIYMTIEQVDELSDDDEYDDEADDDDGTGGMYAGALIGSSVRDTDGNILGTITGINADTANVLFEIERPGGGELLIPVAEEFIAGYDADSMMLTLDLPAGLIDSQS